MPVSQSISQETPDSANGQSTLHELFALTDEQILNIEPEAASSTAPPPERRGDGVIPSERSESRDPGNLAPHTPLTASTQEPSQDSSASSRSATGTSVGMTDSPTEPPKWLAERMNDPWNGEEAREFWQGIQREREEAATYRGVFAKPEDARAAAERSRQLEQIDALYFGAAGKSPEDAAAAREQLAQTLLREDPAAFREMVFAGLRALERAGAAPVAQAGVAQALRPEGVPTGGTVSSTEPKSLAPKGASYSADHRESTIAAYAAFEKAANEELDRDVGGAIGRVLEQALPVAQPPLLAPSRAEGAVRGNAETQAGVPALRGRLSAAIRADIESALKNDRQLAEQVARQLAAKRFDDTTRAQVVRLIGERARQLVPGVARRVLNDWTQTALAAHRARTQKSEAAASRREVEPGVAQAGIYPGAAGRPEALSAPRDARSASRSQRPVDYRKLSDEQILDL